MVPFATNTWCHTIGCTSKILKISKPETAARALKEDPTAGGSVIGGVGTYRLCPVLCPPPNPTACDGVRRSGLDDKSDNRKSKVLAQHFSGNRAERGPTLLCNQVLSRAAACASRGRPRGHLGYFQRGALGVELLTHQDRRVNRKSNENKAKMVESPAKFFRFCASILRRGPEPGHFHSKPTGIWAGSCDCCQRNGTYSSTRMLTTLEIWRLLPVLSWRRAMRLCGLDILDYPRGDVWICTGRYSGFVLSRPISTASHSRAILVTI